jgi:hypothetical protein
MMTNQPGTTERLCQPEEIAAVLLLCGPGASFVASHALVVDGWYTAQ